MKETMRNKKEIFINSIMKENNISCASVDKSKENDKDEIEKMNQIFYSKDDLSKMKCAVLLSLISRNRAEENIDYYKNFKNLEMESFQSYKEKYKTVIIASLELNNLFFVSACNWCGLIQADVRKIKTKDPKKKMPRHFPSTDNINTEATQSIAVTIVFIFYPPEDKAVIVPKTYDTTGYTPKSLGDGLDVDDIKGIYYGHLDCLWNRRSKLFGLTFKFWDKKTKQPVSDIPFYLDVDIILNSDQSRMPRTIKLNKPSPNPSMICSEYETIDLTEGFCICKLSEA